ncbi:hypothetical protein AQUCO_01400439v1 [Aquilegia coerulea]|uniref:Agenet domain-containing protein n=1 Tax=Aquilegia coerulea TaxID=218851 RepID=A0A2G5DWM0_AQUCA|nr:hypothetical protein AQUCO_01400439v1 [Aquilegia coerulea]
MMMMMEMKGKDFKKGQEVEVTTDEEGFEDSWYVATILRKSFSKNKYKVKYFGLLNDDESEPLTEYVEIYNIRPLPPKETVRVTQSFELNQEVDAFLNDGWWKGVIHGVIIEGLKFSVFFPPTKEILEFDQTDLRAHIDWIDGKWVSQNQVLFEETAVITDNHGSFLDINLTGNSVCSIDMDMSQSPRAVRKNLWEEGVTLSKNMQGRKDQPITEIIDSPSDGLDSSQKYMKHSVQKSSAEVEGPFKKLRCGEATEAPSCIKTCNSKGTSTESHIDAPSFLSSTTKGKRKKFQSKSAVNPISSESSPQLHSDFIEAEHSEVLDVANQPNFLEKERRRPSGSDKKQERVGAAGNQTMSQKRKRGQPPGSVQPIPSVQESSPISKYPTLCYAKSPLLLRSLISLTASFDATIVYNEAVKSVNWHLCNTSYELEPASFDLVPNVLPIGPLLASSGPRQSLGRFWPEDSSCLNWLNQQAARSVIYVAFGSLIVFDHMTKESSSDVYPDGFQTRVAAQGQMVAWAPQQKVLSHPSVACFISHCGWNSTMESLSNGVPFLCWPFFADQFQNQSLICDVWMVGLGLNKNENGIVPRQEIKEKVNELLANDGIRTRVTELKETIKKSVASVFRFEHCSQITVHRDTVHGLLLIGTVHRSLFIQKNYSLFYSGLIFLLLGFFCTATTESSALPSVFSPFNGFVTPKSTFFRPGLDIPADGSSRSWSSLPLNILPGDVLKILYEGLGPENGFSSKEVTDVQTECTPLRSDIAEDHLPLSMFLTKSSSHVVEDIEGVVDKQIVNVSERRSEQIKGSREKTSVIEEHQLHSQFLQKHNSCTGLDVGVILNQLVMPC